MEAGQRFILWCLFINPAFSETEGKYVVVGNLSPFPGMEKGWHLDMSYSAVLGMHIFPRQAFLNLVTFWLLRSSSGSQFLFPTESSLDKAAVLLHVGALFVSWSQETSVVMYLPRIHTKTQKSQNLPGASFAWRIITGCCLTLLLTLTSKTGFEVLGGRFRQAKDSDYDVYFLMPVFLTGIKSEPWRKSHYRLSLPHISPHKRYKNVLFGSFPQADISPSDWYSASVRFKINQRGKGLESGENGRVGDREQKTQQRGCAYGKD